MWHTQLTHATQTNKPIWEWHRKSFGALVVIAMAMVVRMGWERVVENVFYSDMESAVSIASTEITMLQKIDGKTVDSCVPWLVCLCSFVQSRLWWREASTVILWEIHRRTLNSSAISRRQVKQINHRACNACFTSFRNLMQSNMRWPHVVCSCVCVCVRVSYSTFWCDKDNV